MKRSKLSRKPSKEVFAVETRSVVVNFLGLIPSHDGPLTSSQASSGSFAEQLRGLGSPDQPPPTSLATPEGSFDLESSEGQPNRSRLSVGPSDNAVFGSQDLPLVPLEEGKGRPDSLQVRHNWSDSRISSYTTDVGHGSTLDILEPVSSLLRLQGESSGSSPRHSTPINNGATEPQALTDSGLKDTDDLSDVPRSQSAPPPPHSYIDSVDCLQDDSPADPSTSAQEPQKPYQNESHNLSEEAPTDALSESHTLSEGTHGDSMSESYTLSGGHTPADTSAVEAAESDCSRDTIDVDQLDPLPSHLCGPADISRMAGSGHQRQLSSGAKMDPIPENRMMKSAKGTDRQLSRTSDDSLQSDLSSIQAASRSSRASSRVSVFEISQEDLKVLVRTHTLPSAALPLQHALSEELRRPVRDEVEEQLEADGACDSGPTPSPISSGRVSPESEVARQLGIIGDAIQEQYSRPLNTAVARVCQLTQGDLTYDRLAGVARDAGILLDDVHSWRQVVLWLVFSQRLAFGLLQQGEKQIRRLVDLTTQVLEDKMASFIINQGGWAAIQDLEVDSPVSVSDISPRFPDTPSMADAAPGNPASMPGTEASAAAAAVVNGDHMDHGEIKPAPPKTPPKVAPKPPPRPQVAANPPTTDSKADSKVKAEKASTNQASSNQTPPSQPAPPPVPPRVNVKEKSPAKAEAENPAQSAPVAVKPPVEKAPAPAAASQSTPPPAEETSAKQAEPAAAAAPERNDSPPQGAENGEADVPVDVEKIRPEINMMRQISEQFDEDSENRQHKYSMAKLALYVGAAALAGAVIIFLARKRK